MRPGRAPTKPARRAPADAHRRSVFGNVLAVLALLGLGVYAYSLIAPRFAATPTPRRAVPTAPAIANAPTVPTTSAAPATAASGQRFQCDGRTHCAQMTSCEEATYFLRNCPGAQMDGNHDGVPCERQWCHYRAGIGGIRAARDRSHPCAAAKTRKASSAAVRRACRGSSAAYRDRDWQDRYCVRRD